MIKTILEIGNPLLRKACEEVIIHNEQTILCYNDLVDTLHSTNGVGISAPQIGYLLRMCVVKVFTDIQDRKSDSHILTLINPIVVSHSEEIVEDREGCLSIPGKSPTTGLRALVPRYRSIEISYYDMQNTSHTQIFEGFNARILQHEIDHLNGVLFLDNIQNHQSVSTYDEYQKIIA